MFVPFECSILCLRKNTIHLFRNLSFMAKKTSVESAEKQHFGHPLFLAPTWRLWSFEDVFLVPLADAENGTVRSSSIRRSKPQKYEVTAQDWFCSTKEGMSVLKHTSRPLRSSDPNDGWSFAGWDSRCTHLYSSRDCTL